MDDFKDFLSFLSPYLSAESVFYLGLVLVPLFIFMKWGLTPRSFIEFLDFVYERKLKKIDHDLGYFSDGDVQKKILERERVILINAHHTGIKKAEFQDVILKTIASNIDVLGVGAYQQTASYLRKKNGRIYIERNLNFWFNWLFTLCYSALLTVFALLLLIPTVINFQNHSYGKAFGSFLLIIITITVITILLTSGLGIKKSKELNALLEDEQRRIDSDNSSDPLPIPPPDQP